MRCAQWKGTFRPDCWTCSPCSPGGYRADGTISAAFDRKQFDLYWFREIILSPNEELMMEGKNVKLLHLLKNDTKIKGKNSIS